MSRIYSWGLSKCEPKETVTIWDQDSLLAHLPKINAKILPRGYGRSYGDICLTDDIMWDMCQLQNFLEFDKVTGTLHVEAGVSLYDIQKICIEFGWMLPVSPGTAKVSVGGAIANDVHGKNHLQAGAFGNHLLELKLLRTNGEVLICSEALNRDLFHATIGGMGLTGIIIEAKLKLAKARDPWFKTTNLKFFDIDDFLDKYQALLEHYDHLVGWVNGVAEGITGIIKAGVNTYYEGKPEEPITRRLWQKPLFSLVNKFSIALLNKMYMNKHRENGEEFTSIYEFLYPLDAIENWNYLYGRGGFLQYQCVLPEQSARESLHELFFTIRRAKITPTLVVLKKFGSIKSLGLMSFPMEGVTVALDLCEQGEKTKNLLLKLDAIVANAKGRVYPAKDKYMQKSLFQSGFCNLEKFRQYCDPGISSLLAQRLLG